MNKNFKNKLFIMIIMLNFIMCYSNYSEQPNKKPVITQESADGIYLSPDEEHFMMVDSTEKYLKYGMKTVLVVWE
jgi:hypothetical protein